MASRQRPRCATLMPNATCAFASLRASANAGAAKPRESTSAMNNMPAAKGRFIWFESISNIDTGLDRMQGIYGEILVTKSKPYAMAQQHKTHHFRVILSAA